MLLRLFMGKEKSSSSAVQTPREEARAEVWGLTGVDVLHDEARSGAPFVAAVEEDLMEEQAQGNGPHREDPTKHHRGMRLTARKLPSILKVLELPELHLLFILFSLVTQK